MRRTLLLAATLGAFAMLAAPASAGDYRSHRPPVTSSFFGFFVSPAPKTIHHYHPRPRYLHPQPVYRYVHPVPRPRWYSWHRPQVRHFDRRHDGRFEWRSSHREWRPDRSPWRHGQAEWRHGDRDRRDGDGWRNRDDDRRHGDGWRNRSGRDYAGHDRRRD